MGSGGTRVRVVVADDNAAVRGAIGAVVARADGFELVGEAVSGDELLRFVGELLPDLAVVDVRMAGIDGIEASHWIARFHPETVVILVTAGDVDTLPPTADASPAAAKLTKAELTARRLAQIWSDHGESGRAR
jgi:two-component system, NarL family, invasion response regulator UvrY